VDGADRATLDALQTPHASWLDLTASIVTILGQSEVVGVVALGVAIAWLRARRRDWWLPLLLVVVVAVEVVGKVLIAQDPPPHELSRSIHFLPFLEAPTHYAFPSGHVARMAFLVTALRWPSVAAMVLVLVMALTRVYLAEHWPSDVLGGWLLGYSIATIAKRPLTLPQTDR
jgi:undecaprenyl-diphosphatase